MRPIARRRPTPARALSPSSPPSLPPLQPGVWSEEEDALLALWQGRVGNRWSEVARYIPGKTGQQCAQVWRAGLAPPLASLLSACLTARRPRLAPTPGIA